MGNNYRHEYAQSMKKFYPELYKESLKGKETTTEKWIPKKRYFKTAKNDKSDFENRFQEITKRQFLFARDVWDENRYQDGSTRERVRPLTYRGLISLKSAVDLVLYSTLIWELQPKTIIEFGSLQGGSSLWFADQLDALCKEGEVHSFELLDKCIHSTAKHPRLHFHHFDARRLDAIDNDLIQNLPHPWLIVEDAHSNIINLLAFMNRFMDKGDYYVMEDAQWHLCVPIGTKPVDPPDHWSAAIQRIAKLGFLVDSKYTDMFGYNVTSAPNSWLRKF